jgi:hypothetical protein
VAEIIVRNTASDTVQLAPQTQAALFWLSIWTEEDQWSMDAATVDAEHADRLVRLARADGFTVEAAMA